jgi:hypothetical protein
MVIDGATIITGSFNFTAAAQKSNAENLLVLKDPLLAGEYRAVSMPYAGALPSAAEPTEGPGEALRDPGVREEAAAEPPP